MGSQFVVCAFQLKLHNLIIKKNHIFYSHRNGKENHVMSGGTKRVWSVSFDEPKKRKSYSSNPDGDLSKDRLPRPPSAPADGVGVLSVCCTPTPSSPDTYALVEWCVYTHLQKYTHTHTHIHMHLFFLIWKKRIGKSKCWEQNKNLKEFHSTRNFSLRGGNFIITNK